MKAGRAKEKEWESREREMEDMICRVKESQQ